MSFTATPVDGSATPIPMSGGVPDGTNTPVALESGPAKSTGGNNLAPAAVYMYDGYNVTFGSKGDAKDSHTDATAITMMQVLKQISFMLQNPVALPANQSTNIAQINGTTPLIDALGQMTVEQFVQYQIMQGHGYITTTGNIATAANNAFVALQLTGNNLSKNVLLYSVMIGNGSGLETDGRLLLATSATADSNLTTNLLTASVGNMQIGGGASSLTTVACSPASTTQTSGLQGTSYTSWLATANTLFEILAPSRYIYAPKNTTWSIEIAQKKATSGNNCQISISWVEF